MSRRRATITGWMILALSVPAPAVYAESSETTIDVAATIPLPCELRLPDDFDPGQEHDLVVALHGFGGSASGFAAVADPFLDARMIFVAPRAPSPLRVEGGIGFAWGLADPEPEGSPRRVAYAQAGMAYIIEVVDTLREHYRIRDVYLFGFSQGGAYALLAGLHHPDRITGILSIGMGFDRAWFAKGKLETAVGVPVWMAHSPKDSRIPISLSRETAKTLRDLGYDVALHEYKGGHRVTPRVLRRAIEWIHAQNPATEDD